MSGLLRLFGSRVVSCGRPKISAMKNYTRMSMFPPTLPRDHNHYNGGDQSRDWTKKNGFYGAAAVIGAGFAVGGIMTYANKMFADEKASCSGKVCDIPKAPEPFSECFAGKQLEESPRNPEAMIVKANQDLEKSLKKAQKLAMEAIDDALETFEDAQDVFLKFLDRVVCIEAMGMNKARKVFSTKEAMSECCDLLIDTCQMIKDVIEKESVAWDKLQRFSEVIENGKANQYTASNPLLVTAEKTFLGAAGRLQKAANELRSMGWAFQL